jgi:hypothetical protein
MPILILKLNISCKVFVLGKIVKYHVSEGGDGMGQGDCTLLCMQVGLKW